MDDVPEDQRPGGQPIGALEAAFVRLGKLVRHLLPKRGNALVEATA